MSRKDNKYFQYKDRCSCVHLLEVDSDRVENKKKRKTTSICQVCAETKPSLKKLIDWKLSEFIEGSLEYKTLAYSKFPMYQIKLSNNTHIKLNTNYNLNTQLKDIKKGSRVRITCIRAFESYSEDSPSLSSMFNVEVLNIAPFKSST